MTIERTIDKEIEIRATPERVFEAWTDPQQLAAWWGDEDHYQTTRCDFDLRVGGKWRSNGVLADGTPFYVEGEYLVVDPPHALSFTWNKSWLDEPTTVVALEFIPTPSGTRLKLTHSGFAVEESFVDHDNGWPTVLGWMQTFVERDA